MLAISDESDFGDNLTEDDEDDIVIDALPNITLTTHVSALCMIVIFYTC